MNAPRRRNLSLGALFGVSVMAGLVAWGVAEHTQRATPTLAGRRPMTAPAWTAPVYAELCGLAGRCDTAWDAIRWYAVDSTALPLAICEKVYEAQGCFESETKALTLTAASFADTVLVRHELMHAAVWTRAGGRHLCRYFRDDWRTLTSNGCEL